VRLIALRERYQGFLMLTENERADKPPGTHAEYDM
jgi:hypothetical protein